MQLITLCLFSLILISAECSRNVSRSKAGGLKKEPHLKNGRRSVRGEVFENLFNVYDPSFLGVVWPKITNGVHILVEHSCWRDMNVFFKDFSEGKSWAYSDVCLSWKIRTSLVLRFYHIRAISNDRKSLFATLAVDASGRYGSALFSGNRYCLGSKDQCYLLDEKSIEKDINQSMENLGNNDLANAWLHKEQNFDTDTQDWKWMMRRDEIIKRLSAADYRPPYRLAYTVARINLNITKINMLKTYDVTLGVCLPRSCSSYDLTSIINFSIIMNDNLKTNKTTSRTAKTTAARQIRENYDLIKDAGAILLITITVVLAVLAIVATVVDLNLVKCIPYKKKSMTFNLEKYNHNPKNMNNNSNGNKQIAKYGDNVNSQVDNPVLDTSVMNYMVVDNMIKCGPPTITLDVDCADRLAGSCKRCGKYKKQCNSPKQMDNLPPCPRIQYSSSSSLSTDSKKRNIFYKILLCFSLNYCCKRIFNTNTANKDLSLIHMMRIIATLWMVFIHVAVVVDYLSDDAGNVEERSNVYYILATGTIAFDTLFFVSGVFSSHHFFYLKSQYSMEELVGFRGACGQVLQFVCFVTNRVIRLLPSYAYVVLLSAVLSRVANQTATLALPELDYSNCNVYWWRNLLYVSNMYPGKEQCMQISWYLSTETQLHAAGALLCAASVTSSWRARLAVALALAALLSATVADASAAYFDYGRLTDVFAAYKTIIERPWARVAPYFVGVFTGWLVHIMQGNMKVSKVTSYLLWTTSASFIFASSALPWLRVPWVAAWLHLAWPIALMWPVLICTTNFAGVFRRLLESPAVAALSRLCYGVVLLHGTMSRALLLSTDTALCSHTMCIWSYFAGTTVLTILAALLLSLLVEMPCCSILRRLSDCAST